MIFGLLVSAHLGAKHGQIPAGADQGGIEIERLLVSLFCLGEISLTSGTGAFFGQALSGSLLVIRRGRNSGANNPVSPDIKMGALWQESEEFRETGLQCGTLQRTDALAPHDFLQGLQIKRKLHQRSD